MGKIPWREAKAIVTSQYIENNKATQCYHAHIYSNVIKGECV